MLLLAWSGIGHESGAGLDAHARALALAASAVPAAEWATGHHRHATDMSDPGQDHDADHSGHHGRGGDGAVACHPPASGCGACGAGTLAFVPRVEAVTHWTLAGHFPPSSEPGVEHPPPIRA